MSDSAPVPKSSNPAYNPLLVSAKTAAAMCGLGRRFLWTLTARGEIPAVRVGRRGIRYRVADLEAWVASRPRTRPDPVPLLGRRVGR